MNEKTLLFGALAATTIAAGFGVYKAREKPPSLEITPVSRLDSARILHSVEVPVRLTASDGTGIRLVSLKASAAIEDPLALTELHLVFENPEDRVLEGTFQIALPQGASVSRFAMKVGDTWQEGEVVEKQRAREVYEDFLHRKQDPALMEQAAGNEFSARVFPIPARGKKEIIVAYSEALEAGSAYVLPLKGLPALATLDIDVHASGGSARNTTFGLHQPSLPTGVVGEPLQDFVVDARALPRSAGLRSGELMMARVIPFATSRPEPFESAIVLVDTSASRALGMAEQASLIQRTFAKLPPDARVTVACFDQEVVPIYEGTVSGFGEQAVKAITQRGALGASDFQQAIAWAGGEAKKKQARRVVVVGDGVATAGETDGQKIKLEVEKLRASKIERIDAIAIGGIRDDAFLRSLVRGVLDKDGVVLDAQIGPDGLARRLGEATLSGVPVKVEGATWSWPKTLDGLQAGDEIIVHAEVAPQVPVRIDVGGQQFTPDLRTTERPLVERAWAQAKIQSLVEAPTEDPATTKARIVLLSTKHRVVSAHTAMLVLEMDADYRRFGIDRAATSDVLSVQDGRIAVLRRSRAKPADFSDRDRDRDGKDDSEKQTAVSAPPPPPPPAPASGSASTAPITVPPASEPVVVLVSPASPEAATQTVSPGPMLAPTTTATMKAPPHPVAPSMPSTPPGAGKSERHASPVPSPRPPSHKADRAAPKPKSLDDETKKALEALQKAQLEPLGDPSSSTSRANPQDEANHSPHGSVRHGELVVERGLSGGEAQRVLRSAIPRLRACYSLGLRDDPYITGQLRLRIVINASGGVERVEPTFDGRPTFNASALGCSHAVMNGLRFPAPANGQAVLTTTFQFVLDPSGSVGPVAKALDEGRPPATPYEGRFKVVMDLIARGEKDEALGEANRWHTEQPGDVMALVALGEALEAKGDVRTAARAYGSILELFSFRADSRRFAGERLEHLHDPAALRLATDSYAKAVAQRPDHPTGHRLYGFALLKRGEHEKAFEALRAGATRTYPSGRFLGADRILREDLGLVAASWARSEPRRAGEIHQRLRAAGGQEENEPSLRFVMVWETDANDVDFHIYDGRGGHAYYSQKDLASGGALYADVTTGYGPECFTIRGPKERRAYPYALQANYYSRGPMGYGMGTLEVIDHDGKGNLVFDERPYIIMSDLAYVDLGVIAGAMDRGSTRQPSAMK